MLRVHARSIATEVVYVERWIYRTMSKLVANTVGHALRSIVLAHTAIAAVEHATPKPASTHGLEVYIGPKETVYLLTVL